MAVLIVPELDEEPWPTLGPALAQFIQERCIYGPGSLAGQAAILDDEKLAALYRLYEVFPRGPRARGSSPLPARWRRVAQGNGEDRVRRLGCLLRAPPRRAGPHRRLRRAGNPVGKPVEFPYIPMVAVTEEQVSELAYGVLKYVVEEGPDADLFDSGLDRIIRLDHRGQNVGVAVPVANAPNSRDGALTTFQHFDEPHRLYLPNHKAAHETMTANLTKRPLEDPWSFYTSTAGKLGQNSIQEDLRKEAEAIDRGEIEDPALFFFSRWAGDEHDDLSTIEQRIAAVSDATGPAGEYGPGQFLSIAKQWDRKGADQSYLERVWLNRWRQGSSQAFNLRRWAELARPEESIAPGAWVSLGFDGARFRDATALVMTDINTGLQMPFGLWERPIDVEDWEVPEDEVTEKVAEAFRRYDVWKLYADPPHWTETVGTWAAAGRITSRSSGRRSRSGWRTRSASSSKRSTPAASPTPPTTTTPGTSATPAATSSRSATTKANRSGSSANRSSS
jgi:hypothetical protein